jgi:hypothetical protein
VWFEQRSCEGPHWNYKLYKYLCKFDEQITLPSDHPRASSRGTGSTRSLAFCSLSGVFLLLWFLPSVEILSHRGRDSNWFWVDKEGSSGELHPYLGDSFKPAYSFLGCHESRCSIGVYMILYRIWFFYFRLVESILQYHFVRSLLRLSYSVKTSLLAIHRRINCD